MHSFERKNGEITKYDVLEEQVERICISVHFEMLFLSVFRYKVVRFFLSVLSFNF